MICTDQTQHLVQCQYPQRKFTKFLWFHQKKKQPANWSHRRQVLHRIKPRKTLRAKKQVKWVTSSKLRKTASSSKRERGCHRMAILECSYSEIGTITIKNCNPLRPRAATQVGLGVHPLILGLVSPKMPASDTFGPTRIRTIAISYKYLRLQPKQPRSNRIRYTRWKWWNSLVANYEALVWLNWLLLRQPVLKQPRSSVSL